MVQTKMREYMASGVPLGWLINPSRRQVEIYRPGQATEVLDNPVRLSRDPVRSGFMLNMALVWEQ